MMFNLGRLSVQFALISLLISCGGGGGGSAGGSTSALGGSGLAVNASSIEIALKESSVSSSYFYKISWQSVEVNKIGYGSTNSELLPAWLSVGLIGSSNPITANISVNSSGLSRGIYRTTLRISSFNVLNRLMDNVDIPVTLTVVEAATASSQSAVFTMYEGHPSDTQSITLTRSVGQVTINNAFTYGSVSWLSLIARGNVVDFNINSSAVSLPPGQYAALVYIDYDGGQIAVNVSLTVSTALITPSNVVFNIDANSTNADKTKNITIGSNLNSSLTWSATSDQTWMDVTPANGVTGNANNLTISLKQNQLDTLSNGQYRGNVVVSSSESGVSAVKIPVALTIAKPQVSYVMPFEGVTNRTANVLIRGKGFQSLVNPSVQFGSSAATSFNILSDTEIKASYGALAAGDYPVNIHGTGSTLVTFATLSVRDPIGYSYAVIPGAGLPVKDLFYDNVLQALFVYFDGSTAIRRWKFYDAVPPSFPAQWVSGDASDIVIQYGGVGRMPDGKSIYAVQQSVGNILKIDPAKLSTLRLSGNASAAVTYSSGAFANDGKLLFTEKNGIGRYDVPANNFDFPGAYSNGFDSAQRIAKASLDGSKIFFVSRNVSSQVQMYNASTGGLTVSGLSTMGTTVSVDISGNKVLIGRNIYDSNLTLLGTFPATSLGGVVNGDGTVAYSYESATVGGAIKKYNLNAGNGTGGFVEVASTNIPDTPGAGNVAMTLTPDQGTLFVGGATQLIVIDTSTLK